MTLMSSKLACGTVGKTLSSVTATAAERRNCMVQFRVRCSASPGYQHGRRGAGPSFRGGGLKYFRH